MGLLQHVNVSLKFRFVCFVVLLLTLTIGVFSYYLLKMQRNHLMDITRQKLSDVADTIEKSIQTSMEVGRSQDVTRIIESVSSLPDLNQVRIFSKRGVILISSDPEEVGETIDKEEMKLFHRQKFSTVYDLKSLEKPMFRIIRPIMNEPRCFRCHGANPNQMNGVLEVDVSMQKVHERMTSVRRFMIASALAALAVLMGSLLFLVSRLVNRPIQSLITTMRKAERGDITARAVPDDTPEFGELGRNFNSMITRLQKAQQDLEQMHEQQMERVDRFATIGELAAGIAHEIKNPIAGIGGAIQILMEDLPAEDHRREIFEEILKQIDRIDQDVKDLLSYARTAKPTLLEHDVNKVIKQAVFLVRDRAAQQRVDVMTQVGENIPPVEIDEKQIQQVLVNICLNAIQAMPDGGILKITSSLENDAQGGMFVKLEVEDTGRGISSKHISKIFTPFFTTRHTGTGLGLPISQKIINQHHGTIEVRSKPGDGTCFTLRLPLTRAGSIA
jgi:signal transduction histidine kinase